MYQQIVRRQPYMTNILEIGNLWGKGSKAIYRNYSTLFFIFCIDSSESELQIYDLIHTFVQLLDQNFRTVCELDLIFHFETVRHFKLVLF